MKKYTHVCAYINSRGDTKVKYFESMDAAIAFCLMLDKRIERGTCGGYSMCAV